MTETRALAAALCAALAGAAAGPALAQTSLPPRDPPGAAELPPGATTQLSIFRGEALRSNAVSIAASRLALKRSRDPQVRDLASRVIVNRTAATRALSAEAGAGSATEAAGSGLQDIPTGLGGASATGAAPSAAAVIERLRSAPGDRFDRAYVAEQARSDARMLALCDGFYRTGDTAQGRRFAYEALPYIETDRSRSAALSELFGG